MLLRIIRGYYFIAVNSSLLAKGFTIYSASPQLLADLAIFFSRNNTAPSNYWVKLEQLNYVFLIWIVLEDMVLWKKKIRIIFIKHIFIIIYRVLFINHVKIVKMIYLNFVLKHRELHRQLVHSLRSPVFTAN